jgi:alkanesulfonate monooxygenase SsuD/methylene tetrahydromethanopterin reductase-like flavin-dependent oxidoreductase (luciferase family)
MAITLLRRGELITVPPPLKATRFLAAQAGAEVTQQRRRRMVLGEPQSVRAGLEAIAAEYGAQELIVVTITHDHAARRRSYELLAEAFELEHRPPAERAAAA